MLSKTGRLVSINRSAGGVPKAAVPAALITPAGVEGDRHRDVRHGGTDRAVTLYSMHLIEALQLEGHPIGIGTIGENLTLSGVEWDTVFPGVQLVVGEALLEVTRFTTPCQNIAGSFMAGDVGRVSEKLRPGWSRVCALVLRSGLVRKGDRASVYPRTIESAEGAGG